MIGCLLGRACTLDLRTALIIDLFALFVCTFLLLRHGRISHSHPASIYLFFHLYTVTWRLISLNLGASPLFYNWPVFYDPVTVAELVRASLWFDIALVIVTIACLVASTHDMRKGLQPSDPAAAVRPLSKKHIWRVVCVAFPVGVAGLLYFARLPGYQRSIGFDLGAWERSSWLTMTQTWAGLALLVLVYWYGFRKPLVILLMVYLSIMFIQGYHRFRFFIPLILIIQIYLDQRGRRWPTAALWGLMLAALMLFFPLKQVGSTIQRGGDAQQVISVLMTNWRGDGANSPGDQGFLDQYASTLTLVDSYGGFFYGRPYLALLTLPIPRPLWPDKPSFAGYLGEISTPWRPMGRMGMIVTFLGEAYANFSYVGLLVVPFLLLYWLSRWYHSAYRHGYRTVTHFAYLIMASGVIHVYRGGLTSVFVTFAANMMPLTIVVALHFVWPLERQNRGPYRRRSRPATRNRHMRVVR